MHTSSPAQALIRQTALCTWLGQTRSGLEKLRKKDATFPKPIKDGDTRQAAAYYVVAEVEAWLKRKIAQRDTGGTPPADALPEAPARLGGPDWNDGGRL